MGMYMRLDPHRPLLTGSVVEEMPYHRHSDAKRFRQVGLIELTTRLFSSAVVGMRCRARVGKPCI